MNDKRQQILERLKLRKIKEIHSHFDKDNDGFLNHEELSSLQNVTSGQPISRRKYKSVCSMFDCKPSQGLTFRALVLTYDSNGEADVDRDFDKVFGIKRDSSTKGKKIFKGHDEKKEDCIATNGNDNEQSVNLIDLLSAGEDPSIKPSTEGCSDGLNSMDVSLKQIPSKHTFHNIIGSIMEDPLEESGANDVTNIQSDTKTEEEHLLSHKVTKGSVSEAHGRKTSIPTVVTVDSKDDDDVGGHVPSLPSIHVGSTEGWANDVMSKDRHSNKTSLMGMEGTAYSDLHQRSKNPEDECSCVCTIM